MLCIYNVNVCLYIVINHKFNHTHSLLYWLVYMYMYYLIRCAYIINIISGGYMYMYYLIMCTVHMYYLIRCGFISSVLTDPSMSLIPYSTSESSPALNIRQALLLSK